LRPAVKTLNLWVSSGVAAAMARVDEDVLDLLSPTVVCMAGMIAASVRPSWGLPGKAMASCANWPALERFNVVAIDTFIPMHSTSSACRL
jgi:hypothetical protein